MDSTDNHDDGKTGLTPDDKLRLWAASIKHKRRLGLIRRRSILTALLAALAAVFGSGRSGGAE